MSGGLSQSRNVAEAVVAISSVLPQSSGAATINGVAIDRNAHGQALSCIMHQIVGAITGAPTTSSVQTKLQHADDNGSGAPGAFSDFQIGGTTQQTPAATAQNTEQSLAIDLS